MGRATSSCSAQGGIRDTTVQSSPRFVTTFKAWAIPDMQVDAVRFTGNGYVGTVATDIAFRQADRATPGGPDPERGPLRTGRPRDDRIRTRDACRRARRRHRRPACHRREAVLDRRGHGGRSRWRSSTPRSGPGSSARRTPIGPRAATRAAATRPVAAATIETTSATRCCSRRSTPTGTVVARCRSSSRTT